MKTLLHHPLTVLCVDDDGILAGSLRMLFKHVEGIQWVGHLENADHLAEEASSLCPDIVLLDIRMPGKDPLLALEELMRVCPKARVIVLSNVVNQSITDRAVEAGAWGVICKNDVGLSLPSIIKRVGNGEFVLSDGAASPFLKASALNAPLSNSALPQSRLTVQDDDDIARFGNAH